MSVNEEKKEITAEELAKLNDISYTAAREQLESLEGKGVLGYEWEPKGNKKKYVFK